MVYLDKNMLKVLALLIMAGCAGQTGTIKEKSEAYSCDSLIQRFPEKARPYVKDGCYGFGDKMIYMVKGRCYEVIRDSGERCCCGKRTFIKYWR